MSKQAQIAPKRILYIVPIRFIPPQNGGQVGDWQFAQHLGQATKLFCLSTANNDLDIALRAPFTFLPMLQDVKTKYLQTGIVKKIVRVIENERIDYVFCDQPFFANLASKAAKKTNRKLFVYAKNIEFLRFKSMKKWWWKLLYFWEKKALKKADGVFFVSNDDVLLAQQHFGLHPDKCLFATHGTTVERLPSDAYKLEMRKQLCEKFSIAPETKILTFYGSMNYQPNLEALAIIMEHVLPKISALNFHLLVCGKDLPAKFQADLKANKKTTYVGFVEDIDAFVAGTDLMLNPVLIGGGVKTKVIDALAANTSVVSTQTGILGLHTAVCAQKLFVSKDNDWQHFAEQVQFALTQNVSMTDDFYQYYHWSKVVERVLSFVAHRVTAH